MFLVLSIVVWSKQRKADLYAIFQIPHLTQEFLTGGWIFFKTRRLPVLDVRECAYCVISDSAPRKEILACSDL
ncbi:ATM_1a_G0053680.mRNA.1.CDS.1 [Saccharomyces cerevisiae]|nr:ATM_1a_G0053680.mRNA.1.CDS.1 [Saccharomyces cerevisiae]CAI7371132.1 ATM_1a_G0053680.mRNA.1.CDS.1 [Saccharomyces cerevisiae]